MLNTLPYYSNMLANFVGTQALVGTSFMMLRIPLYILGDFVNKNLINVVLKSRLGMASLPRL